MCRGSEASGAPTSVEERPFRAALGAPNICQALAPVEMVGAAGIEPATAGLEIRCSIRLSYAPIRKQLYRKRLGIAFRKHVDSWLARLIEHKGA
jgi:hypothetical protein